MYTSAQCKRQQTRQAQAGEAIHSEGRDCQDMHHGSALCTTCLHVVKMRQHSNILSSLHCLAHACCKQRSEALDDRRAGCLAAPPVLPVTVAIQ